MDQRPVGRKLHFEPLEHDSESAGRDHAEDTLPESVLLPTEETPPVESSENAHDERRHALKKILRWEKIGRFCLFAAAFLAPIFFVPFTSAPVDSAKIVITALLTLVSLVSFFACVIERRSIQFPKALLSLSVLSFLIISGISAYFSESPMQSLYGSIRLSDSFLSIAIGSLAFFLSFYFLRKEDVQKVGTLVLGSFSLVSVIGLLQLFNIFVFPWDFTKSAAFNPVGSVFAWGICMAIIIAAIATADFSAFPKKTRLVLWAAVLLMAIGLIVLNYQFLWLALTLITIIVASVRFVSREHFRLPLIIVVFSLFFALAGSRFPSFVKVPAEIRPGAGSTLSVGWQAIHGVRAIVGTGPSTFSSAFSQFRSPALNQTNFWGVAFAQGYSYALTLFSTGGIVGVLAFLFILYAAGRYLMDYREHQYTSMLLTGVLFLFISLFFYPAFFAEFFLIFLGLGLIMPESARREVSLEGVSRWRAFGSFIVVLLCIALSLAAFYRISQKYIAAYDYAKASEFFAVGKNDEGFVKLNSALMLDGDSDEYLRGASQVSISQAGNVLRAGGANAGAAVQTNIANALGAAQKAVTINPRDAANFINLGGVYESIIPIANGADQLALAAYEEARKLDPANPQIPVLMARAHIAAGDRLGSDASRSQDVAKHYGEAEDMLNASIALKGDYAIPRFLLAQLYIKEGNVAQAIQKVEEIKAVNPFDAGLAFQLGLLYYQNGQTDKAREEFVRAVSLSPDYSNARYFLGLIYDKAGSRPQALEQFQKIADSNPDNAEIQAIIANLQAGKSALSSITPPAAPPEKRNNVPVPEKSKR